ncbi:MAG TPA: GNAT family N-acetyltransferase [Ktedonobacteraceae bacterium]
MPAYHFSSALEYTMEQISEMHNVSFRGYAMPVEMTPEMTAQFWRINDIDAQHSLVMHAEDGTFVGMARLGIRGGRGWCGGFGIVPEFRGSGASRLLAEEMVRVARECGLSTLQLEVLTQNERARRLYERVGFTTERQLFGLQIAACALPDGALLRARRPPVASLLARFAELPRPCWGCEPATILAAACEALVLARQDGQADDGVIVQRGRGISVLAAFFSDAMDNAKLAELLRQAADDGDDILVYNEPEESPYLDRYRALGFSEFFRQYEMLLTL